MRVTAQYVDRLVDVLSERDRAIIQTLKRVRVATGRQLERLHFQAGTHQSNVRVRQMVLRRLGRLRVLICLDRRIGGVRAGSDGLVYSLDVAGQRLAQSGGPAKGVRLRRPWTPSSDFLKHSLAVSELYVQLREQGRQGTLELMDFDAEPACWRPFLGSGGNRAILKPDAFVRLGLGEFEDSWFIEVDRATESPAAIRRKLKVYQQYWTSGKEQAQRGVFPRVLWLVPHEKRHAQLLDLLATPSSSGHELFQAGLHERAAKILTGAP